jgi:3-oxoacyl-[acyl-carrier protein] reductase
VPERVAIVTGASSGIGRATAVRLADDFSKVVLVARDGLEKVTTELSAAGHANLAIQVDLRRPEAANRVVEETLAAFGRIDALINIAGAVAGTDLFAMSDEQWDDGLALKFHGARRLALRAWKSLMITKGALVFISGNAAVTPRAAGAAIGCVNAAVEALAKAFADRGIQDGIHVNTVSPGAVMTARRLALLEKSAAEGKISIEEAQQRFLQQAGISRFGTAEEIAGLMAFVASPAARWMTGAVLRMDGGEVKSL